MIIHPFIFERFPNGPEAANRDHEMVYILPLTIRRDIDKDDRIVIVIKKFHNIIKFATHFP